MGNSPSFSRSAAGRKRASGIPEAARRFSRARWALEHVPAAHQHSTTDSFDGSAAAAKLATDPRFLVPGEAVLA